MKAMMFVSGAMTVNLIGIGDELGFYKALKAGSGPMSSSDLAKATGTNERWTREWLCQQVRRPASGARTSAFGGLAWLVRRKACAMSTAHTLASERLQWSFMALPCGSLRSVMRALPLISQVSPDARRITASVS